MTDTIPATAPTARPRQLDPGYMDEPYRPQYHYTAEKNMINDPNGLVWHEGEYHLFHQYNLHDAIHWGHAVSTDLVHWEHLPPAIFPDRIGQIYSGTAAVDTANTSGFQQGDEAAMVAAFTYAEHSGVQSQGIAYSNDRGRTWTMFEGNPVIPNPGKPDFRDPKILWHEDTARWVMVLTAGTHLDFYVSPDLKNWVHASEWGVNDGSHDGEWECPDLFEISLEGTTETRWVLSVSIGRGAPAGGSGMQYFIGTFDGTTFRNENPEDLVLWQNYGQDYYAGITWANVPPADGRRLMIAWLDNWLYRFDPPTTPFNGQLSLVRELKLKQFPEGLRLVQNPVNEQDLLRGPAQSLSNLRVEGLLPLPEIRGECLEIIAEFDLPASTADQFGLEVRAGHGRATRIGYDSTTHEVYVDREHSGVTPSHHWAGRHAAPVAGDAAVLTFRIFVDRSSVEVFINEREQISVLILPDANQLDLRLFADGGSSLIPAFRAYPIQRIWSDNAPPSGDTDKWTTLTGEWAETQAGRQASANGFGLSLAQTSRKDLQATATVSVIGATNGNPQPIKAERGAGIMFRANAESGTGYAAVINVAERCIELLAFTSPQEPTRLAAVEADVRTNTPYNLAVTAKGGQLEIALDGQKIVHVDDHQFTNGRSGLLVNDAEVLFQAITLS